MFSSLLVGVFPIGISNYKISVKDCLFHSSLTGKLIESVVKSDIVDWHSVKEIPRITLYTLNAFQFVS